MAFVSIDHQIAEMADEVKRRQRHYPLLVGDGRMRKEEADVRIERAIAILYTLRWLKHIEPRLKNGYIEKPHDNQHASANDEGARDHSGEADEAKQYMDKRRHLERQEGNRG